MGDTSSSDSPGKTALTATAEFIKYTLALDTGALVFSIGLVTATITLSAAAKTLLVLSWTTLTLSIIAGVLAYSRIPIQLAEENYDLEDKYLIIPGRFHQVTFLAGILFLGISLIIVLLSK